jgi:hypothetical protein
MAGRKKTIDLKTALPRLRELAETPRVRELSLRQSLRQPDCLALIVAMKERGDTLREMARTFMDAGFDFTEITGVDYLSEICAELKRSGQLSSPGKDSAAKPLVVAPRPERTPAVRRKPEAPMGLPNEAAPFVTAVAPTPGNHRLRPIRSSSLPQRRQVPLAFQKERLSAKSSGFQNGSLRTSASERGHRPPSPTMTTTRIRRRCSLASDPRTEPTTNCKGETST